MLKTPELFRSLIVSQDHPNPVNLVFSGDMLLVRDQDLHPHLDLQRHRLPQEARFMAVGTLGDSYFQATWIDPGTVGWPGHTFRKLRSLFGELDDALLAIAGRAFQIVEWARTHRYCGACAAPTQPVAHERCVRCSACGHTAYPRISPAMMVLIQRGDAILLARHRNSPTGYFTALAGFLEAGESIEDAIHREVQEEVGLQVRDLRYFGNQAWPFPHSLMLAFTAQYAGGDIVLDTAEIAEARWFGPEDPLPPMPPPGLSISGHLIRAHLPRRAASARAA